MSITFTFPAEEALAEQADRESTGLPALLGIRTTSLTAGTLTSELDVREDFLSPFGMVHGGIVAALVDHVLGSVCYPVIPRGSWSATTEYKVNLLAPVRQGRISARAEIVALTKRTAVVQITVTNGETTIALAQGTSLIMPPKVPASGD